MYKPRLTDDTDSLFVQYVQGYLTCDPEDKTYHKDCLHNMVRNEIVAAKNPLVIEYRKNPDKFPSIRETAISYYSCEDVGEMRSSDLLQELWNIEDENPGDNKENDR